MEWVFLIADCLPSEDEISVDLNNLVAVWTLEIIELLQGRNGLIPCVLNLIIFTFIYNTVKQPIKTPIQKS